jgi:glycosyltransferase involved in cell wall biosynthesis
MNKPGLRKVLMVAFHYPPFSASSGVQRALSFSIHLRRFGWHPYVLTADPRAFERSSPAQLADVPDDVEVQRTLALDAARHLAIKGRYWSRLALPDRWASWWLTAVPAGLAIIRRAGINAIWSTYPIATAHRIAATLSHRSGLPWVADFRDPMVEYMQGTSSAFPPEAHLRNARLRIEARAVREAKHLVFCTEGARDIVLDRYFELDRGRTTVVSNGYEESAFESATATRRPIKSNARRVLLHSGTIYLGPDRDPNGVMQAIRQLADRNAVSPADLELRLRDPSNESEIRKIVATVGVQDFVTILPPLPYREALAEMLSADGLLLLQGQTSNPAIPAKLYEYLRAGRPILPCVHHEGETARTLSALGILSHASLTNPDEISTLIEAWLTRPEHFERQLPGQDDVRSFSRERLTEKVAAILDSLIS